MNTILHLAAFLATGWAMVFAFETLQIDALGSVFVVLFFGYLVLTYDAIGDDVYIYTGKHIPMTGWKSGQRDVISEQSKVALALTCFLFAMAVANHIWG